MSEKKYECGQRITSVDELMHQRFVIHKPNNGPGFEKIYHYGWFCPRHCGSPQLRGEETRRPWGRNSKRAC